MNTELLNDPACVLYLDLSKKDGNSFRSGDRYGRLCTNTGTKATPQGRYFDGMDDRILVQDFYPALSTISAFSFIGWLKTLTFLPENPHLANLFNFGGGTPPNTTGLAFQQTTAIPNAYHFVNGSDSSWQTLRIEKSLDTNTFYCFAGSIRKNTVKRVYLNGDLANSSTAAAQTQMITSTNPFGIGNSWKLHGYLAHITVFYRELCPQEIQTYYEITRGEYQK